MVAHRMSVLLTDVEGSTRLWETSPDEMAAALADHDRILRDVISAHSGRVFGTAGEVILNGLKQYVDEVSDGTFPAKENYFGIKDEEYNELIRELGD